MKLIGIKAMLVALSLLVAQAGFKVASADIIQFRLTGNGGDGLLESNVTPPTGEPGTGNVGITGITIDTVSNIIHIDVQWGSGNGYIDLTQPVGMMHLHGPTPSLPPDSFSETADLLINIGNSANFNSSPTNGGLADDFFVSDAEIEFIRQGRSYINVHFSADDTGMIRGYLVEVPEPGCFLLMCGIPICHFWRRQLRVKRMRG